ncbi:MAG: hypothetical protein WDZ93_00995 [Candidatus Paceibacterota bacterium]
MRVPTEVMSDARKTQGAGGSSSSAVLPETFFQSDNLLRVLAAVRGAGIPDAERTAVRDAILAYAQADESEKASARATLETVIAPHHAALTGHVTGNTSPLPVQKAQPQASVVGTPRPQPRFTPPTPRPQTKQTPPPQPRQEPAAMVPPKEEVPRPAPMKPQSAAPQPPPRPKPAPPTPQPSPEPPPPANTSHDAKTRIAEIKHAVNERVGNPVNLIEKDRAVGQEYMSALLDAIKRTSTPGGGTDEAMKRLEKAYTVVISLLDSPAPVAEVKTPPPQPMAAKPDPVPEPVPPAPKPQSSIPIKPEAKPFADIARRAAAAIQHPAPVQQTDQKEKQQTPVAAPPSEPTVEPKAADAKPEDKPTVSIAAMRAKAKSVREEPTAPETPVETKPKDKAAVSIAAMRGKTTPKADGGDGLNTPEVNAGLEQLLSEWTLFKSSGLFGTGPKGFEHPLYKKLAGLPMAAVIAGRFEGSKPEIKQNIADYMNGWRYEQGIVHRMDEQFEHYLRRVIRHILAKQPQTDGASAPTPKA